jgi:pimeloyl-ACP methyl ester carboxylesterase
VACVTTFVLVHGAWHGSWAWDDLNPHLVDRGHTVVAVDLPLADPDARFEDYANVILRATEGHDDVVLVGHSLGGMSITYAGLKRDVRALVYLCPVVPDVVGVTRDGEPPQSEDGAYDSLVRRPDGSHSWPSLEAAASAMYAACPPEKAAAAFARLRPQQTNIWNELEPLPRWPDSRKELVFCTEDRMFTREWEQYVAKRWLGCEPVELPGDHSPMIGIPAELAQVLEELAR